MANFHHLPRISGYIVNGLVFSPSISGIISHQQIDNLFSFTSEIALAFIAYSIGGSILMSRIRGLGKEILWINLAEGSSAFICTCFAVYISGPLLSPLISANLNTFISVILILGGISVATAPAATMAVVHELRARGPLTTTLLGVVALDDALSIIIFSGAITIASQLLFRNADSSLIVQVTPSTGNRQIFWVGCGNQLDACTKWYREQCSFCKGYGFQGGGDGLRVSKSWISAANDTVGRRMRMSRKRALHITMQF